MDDANEAHLSLAQVCTSMKKFDEAQQEIAKAYHGLRYGIPLWYRIKTQEGISYDEAGKFEAACGCYAEAPRPI